MKTLNYYFIYSAEMWDRSVGKVLINEALFSEEEFKKLVETAKIQTGNYESRITEYLIENYNFKVANIPSCNIELV